MVPIPATQMQQEHTRSMWPKQLATIIWCSSGADKRRWNENRLHGNSIIRERGSGRGRSMTAKAVSSRTRTRSQNHIDFPQLHGIYVIGSQSSC
mmetsp:Transcript_13712/g.27045  ORF Transcript_13712/g.27045 Transcript_13712/m.27045 type:complete len:94 (+) Transcript_13712:1022-1303(+)